MTSENTYNNKQKEEEKPQDTPPATERPFSTQEYNQRWKIVAEESGMLYRGTVNQAREQLRP